MPTGPSKLVECDICGKSVKARGLVNHKRIVHSGLGKPQETTADAVELSEEDRELFKRHGIDPDVPMPTTADAVELSEEDRELFKRHGIDPELFKRHGIDPDVPMPTESIAVVRPIAAAAQAKTPTHVPVTADSLLLTIQRAAAAAVHLGKTWDDLQRAIVEGAYSESTHLSKVDRDQVLMDLRTRAQERLKDTLRSTGLWPSVTSKSKPMLGHPPGLCQDEDCKVCGSARDKVLGQFASIPGVRDALDYAGWADQELNDGNVVARAWSSIPGLKEAVLAYQIASTQIRIVA